MSRLAPGSFLCLSHATTDVGDPELAALGRRVEEIYSRGGTTLRLRDSAEIARFFRGLELIDPGITMAHHWRPDAGTETELKDGEPSMFAGVARKP